MSASSSLACSGRRFGSSLKTGRNTDTSGVSVTALGWSCLSCSCSSRIFMNCPRLAGRRQHCRTVSQTSHPKPFDKAMQALFNLRFGTVAEQFAGLGNVCKGLGNIPWLRRLAVNYRVRVQLFLQERDQFVELDGARLTKIDHFVVGLVVVDG